MSRGGGRLERNEVSEVRWRFSLLAAMFVVHVLLVLAVSLAGGYVVAHFLAKVW